MIQEIQQQRTTTKASRQRGFTLVELMIVVTIIGVLAALATVGVRAYVLHAKTAEATTALGRMGGDAMSAYNRESMKADVLKKGASVDAQNRLCVRASKPVPANISQVKGKKYQSSPSEWNKDSKTDGKGFACLKFSMNAPQYYQYDYKTSTGNFKQSHKSGTWFKAIAKGDLDGDGVRSEYTLQGKISSDGGELSAHVAPAVEKKRADE